MFSVEWCCFASVISTPWYASRSVPEQKGSSLTGTQVMSAYCFVKDMLKTQVSRPPCVASQCRANATYMSLEIDYSNNIAKIIMGGMIGTFIKYRYVS